MTTADTKSTWLSTGPLTAEQRETVIASIGDTLTAAAAEAARILGCTVADVLADAGGAIPATREAAIALLVEHDVARWGEGERVASHRMHSAKTYGLALNELADAPIPALRRAARKALTQADRAYRRVRSAAQAIRGEGGKYYRLAAEEV